MSGPPIDKGWAWMCVFGAHIINFFLIGGYKSLGILFVEFRETFGGSAAMSALMMGLIPGGMSVLSPFATALGERIGYRRIVMLGGILTSSGAFLTYFAPNLLYVATVYGLLTGVGYGLLFSPTMVVIGTYFNKRRSLANGLSMAGGSMGQLVIPQLIRSLTDVFTFKGALLIYSGLILHTVVGGSLFRPFSFYNRTKKTTSDVKNADNRITLDDLEGEKKTENKCEECECQPKSNKQDVTTPVRHENIELSANGANHIETSRLYRRMSGCECQCHMSELDTSKHLFSSTGSLYFLPMQHQPIANQPQPDMHREPLWSAIKASFCCCCDPHNTAKPLLEWDMFYNYLFILYTFSLCVGNVGYVNTFLFIPPFMADLDISKQHAALLLSIGGVSDLVGRILGGWFADLGLIKRHNIMGLSIAVASVSALICPLFPVFPSMVILVLVMGFFGGFYIALMAVVLVDFVGIEKMPKAFGMTIMFMGITNMGTPSLLGHIRDSQGSFKLVFIINAILMAVCAICFLCEPIARKMEHRRLYNRSPGTSSA